MRGSQRGIGNDSGNHRDNSGGDCSECGNPSGLLCASGDLDLLSFECVPLPLGLLAPLCIDLVNPRLGDLAPTARHRPLAQEATNGSYLAENAAEVHRLTAEIAAAEREIDALVYRLFDLTDDEIALLEVLLEGQY